MTEQKIFEKQKQKNRREKAQLKASNLKELSKVSHIICSKIKSSIKNAMKIMVNISKQTYRDCYVFLKEKGILDKVKINKRLTLYLFISLIIILISLFVLIINVHHPKTGPSSISNLMKINTMQAELSNIQNTVTTTSQMNVKEKQTLEVKLQEINKKLNDLSEGNDILQSSSIKNLQTTLQSNKINLSKKISALNKEINDIKTKVFPVPTLNASVLPFKVVSVDPWNGRPYAEVVQLNNQTMISYVGLDQTLGGWKVADINAPEQTVTFINSQGQVVHVQVKLF